MRDSSPLPYVKVMIGVAIELSHTTILIVTPSWVKMIGNPFWPNAKEVHTYLHSNGPHLITTTCVVTCSVFMRRDKRSHYFQFLRTHFTNQFSGLSHNIFWPGYFCKYRCFKKELAMPTLKHLSWVYLQTHSTHRFVLFRQLFET